MAAVDTLLVRIEADMQGLRRDLARVQRQTTNATAQMSQGFRGTQRSTVALGQSLGKLQGIIAGLGLAMFGRSVIRANAEMEDLRSTLTTVFGTAERGEAAFKFINNFAQRTPFDIQTLSKAFIQLRGAGIAPTEKLLTTLGNAASTTTNAVGTFESMVTLLQRSMGGGLGIEQIEILQTAGLPVFTILEERLGKTRLELGELGKTAEGSSQIVQALMDHFDDAAPDGMANRSRNLSTHLSNLGIAANNALLQIGDAGLTDALKSLVIELDSAVKSAKPVLEVIGRSLGAAVKLLAENLGTVTKAFTAFLATLVVTKIAAATMALLHLAKSAIAAGGAFNFISKAIRRTPLGLAAFGAVFAADKLGALERVFDKLGISMGELEGEMADAANGLKELEDQMNAGMEGGGAAERAAKARKKRLDELKEQLEEVRLEAEKARLQVAGVDEETIKAFQDQGGRFPVAGPTGLSDLFAPDQVGVVEQIREQALARDELNEAIAEQKRAVDSAKSAVEGLVTEEEKLIQVQNDLRLALDLGEISAAEFKQALAATKEEMFKQSDAGKAVISTIGEVSSQVSSGIANVITQSGQGLESFKTMFTNIINSLIKKMIEAKIEALLMSQAMTMFGGGGGGGFSLSGLFSGISNFFSGPTVGNTVGGSLMYGPSAGGLATGGPVSAGRSFLVGERGPELFTPRASGMITPNNMMNIAMSRGQNLRGSGGGPQIVQNLNMSLGVQQTVRAEVMNMMPMIKQASVDAVIDARQRGGSLASSLGA